MCGIAGALGPRANESLVGDMTRSLAHRGPDGEGVAPVAGGFLGHRRLSIIDLSEAGRQPMVSADGRWSITFNGEIYNYRELRQELADYPFRSHTDTEVILAAWSRWGEQALERFLGMFTFALADRETGRVTLVRDRLGIKPLYYAVHEGTLLFGSEIKALLAAGAPQHANEQTIAQYLLRGYYDHSPQTFFQGIEMLPPGHLLIWDEGKANVRRWWYLPERVEAVTQLADAEVVDAFQALFDSSVDMHLRSDVSVGINLSSGVDSISLFYELKRLNKLKQLSIFSMGFAEPEFDETIEIAKLAAAEHVPFHRVEIRPEVQTRLADRVVEQLDQPFGGLSSIGYYELMTAPRAAGVKVLLEGQGVDELLGGYNYFLGPLYLDYLRNRDWSRVAAEIKRLAHGGGLFSLIRATRKLLGLARNVQRPVFQDGSEFLRLSCLKPEWVNWARQTPRPVFEQPFSGALANALYRDTRYTKLPRVLRFNDHLSMAFGIELRVPYLDHRLAELAFCLPNRWKIDRGFTKALLREAMKELVPDAIRLKQKRPQSSPQTTWYKGPLRDAVLDEIRSDRFRRLPMVDAQATERAFLRFVDDPKDQNSFFFWQLINLARWAERFAV